MKKLMLITVALAGFVAARAEVRHGGPRNPLTPEQRARMEKYVETHHGGYVEIKAVGKIVVFNMQERIPLSLVEGRAKLIGRSAGMPMEVRSEKHLATGLPSLPKDVTVGVFIVNRPDLPLSLLAVEEHWGLVNVAKIAEAGVPDDKVQSRFCREYSRVSSLIMGGYMSPTVKSVLRPVSSAKDLDNLFIEGFSYDTIQLIEQHMKKIGYVAPRRLSYRKACSEGIAPAPTNAVQKAIWEQVHQLPTKPLTIEKTPASDKAPASGKSSR